MLDQPIVYLSNAAQLPEFEKYQRDCLLNAFIGIFPDRVVRGLDVSGADHQIQLTTSRLLLDGSLRALAQNTKLHFAELAFQAEQKAVIG